MGVLEFIVAFIVELVLYGLGEAYLYLVEMFIPQKALMGKGRILVPILALVISGAFLAGLVFGLIHVIVDRGQNVWGWIGIGLGLAYLVAGIALKIAAKRKKISA